MVELRVFRGYHFIVKDEGYRTKWQERIDPLMSTASTHFCYLWNDCSALSGSTVRLLRLSACSSCFQLGIPLFCSTFLVAHVSLISSPFPSPYSHIFYSFFLFIFFRRLIWWGDEEGGNTWWFWFRNHSASPPMLLHSSLVMERLLP